MSLGFWEDKGTGGCVFFGVFFSRPPPPPISSIIPSVTHTRFQSLILLCPKDTWAKRNAWSDVGEGALEKFLQIARDFDCIKQCAQGLKTHRACMCRDAHGYRWVVSIERRHRFWALHGTLCVLGWLVWPLGPLNGHSDTSALCQWNSNKLFCYLVCLFVCVQACVVMVRTFPITTACFLCTLLNLISRNLNPPCCEGHQMIFQAYTF